MFAAYPATLLVHEVTHGQVDRKSSRRNHDPLREEAICHREQRRCLDRLGKRMSKDVESVDEAPLGLSESDFQMMLSDG